MELTPEYTTKRIDIWLKTLYERYTLSLHYTDIIKSYLLISNIAMNTV